MYFVYLIFFCVVFFLGHALWKKDMKAFVMGQLLSLVFLRFVSEKLYPYHGDALMALFLRTGGLLLAFWAILLHPRPAAQLRIHAILIVSFVYIFLIGASRFLLTEYVSLFTNYVAVFYYFIVLWLLSGYIRFSTMELVRFMVGIGVFQAFLGYAQFWAPDSWIDMLTIPSYRIDPITKRIGLETRGLDAEIGTIVQGSLRRFNIFGNFQAFVFLLQLGYVILLKNDKGRKQWAILALIGASVLLSGNRASLLSLIGGTLLLLFYFRRTLFYVLLGAFGSVFLFANTFMDKLASGYETGGDPISRALSAFMVFKGSQSWTENNSTLFLSYTLIPDFLAHPIMGAGKYFKEGYEFIGHALRIRIADANIMVLLTDLGLLGGSFFVLPFIYFYGFVRKRLARSPEYVIALSFMLLFLLQTVTDSGLFGQDATYFFVTLVVFFIRDHYARKARAEVSALRPVP